MTPVCAQRRRRFAVRKVSESSSNFHSISHTKSSVELQPMQGQIDGVWPYCACNKNYSVKSAWTNIRVNSYCCWYIW